MGMWRRGRRTPERMRSAVSDLIDAQRLARSTAPMVADQLPPVWAARTLIADTLAQLPLVAMRGTRPRAVQPPIVTKPDPSQERWETMHRLGMDLSGRGRAWLLVSAWDAADNPMAIKLLPDIETTAQVDEYGDPVSVTWKGRTWRVPAEVVHIPLDLAGSDRLGTSPLQSCRQALEALAYLWEFESSFYAEGGLPPVALKMPYRVDPVEAEQIRASFLGVHLGRRVPAVVGGQGEIVPLGLSARDAALTEAHAQAVADVARLWRIPPSLLNAPSGGSLTYSTTEGEFRKWLATGLQAYLMRVEAAFTSLLPLGTTARADTSELLRSDFASRVQAYSVALGGAPWLDPDEVRAMEGRPPRDVTPVAAPATAPNLQGV